MSNPPIQAQWSLSQTAGAAVTMSMGMLSALHGDNVQPLAYLACEKFGATLAISTDTTRKIEAVVVPPTAPAAITFLQAQVGFFRDDCATQFGMSQAGVRFLALAAALTSTLPIFHAAQAVEIMLRATTSDLRMLPSTRHLKHLLESLEPRCHRAGFANDVLGWKILFHQIIVPSLKSRRSDQDVEQIPAYREGLLLDNGPSAEMVDRLVDAFRQIGRVGESTASRVTVRLCCAVPWVTAFTKWSLGAPPRIQFDSPDAEILPSNSPVTLLVPRHVEDIDDSKEVEVAIYHAIGHPRQLLAPPSKELWMGMVPVESYGKLILQKFRFETDFERRMLNEALSCAIPKCLELLHLSTLIPEGIQKSSSEWVVYRTMNIDMSVAHHRLKPLPYPRKIAAACVRLFGLPRSPAYKTSPTSRRVGDYPLVKDYLAMLESHCACVKCMGRRGCPGNADCKCELDAFYHRLSRVVVTVLALSLLEPVPEDPEPLLLSVASLMGNSADWRPITGTIQALLEDDQGQAFNVTQLLTLARVLAGHDGNTSIMSSEKGQVLFQSLFATQCIVKDGYMALSYLPGVLKYDNITYRKADSIPESQMGTGSVEESSVDKPPVITPQNLFTDLETCWEVRKVDDYSLGCTLKVRSKSGTSSYGYLNPMNAVFGLMNGLFLESCPHDSRAALDQPDEFANYRGIFDDDEGHVQGETSEPGSRVNIVAVDGAEDLRMAAISRRRLRLPLSIEPKGPPPFYVLRGSSCLACCLKLCRRVGIQHLIL